MSLPEASLENLELGLRNVLIHQDEGESRISKDYLSNNNVSQHNGKGMYRDLKEEDVEEGVEEEEEEEEEDDDDDIEADILRQSGYATIKKPCHQPIPVKEEDVVDEDEEEEEEDTDIDADILRQSGYATIKKPCNQPMPVKDDDDDDEDEEDEEDDIQKQSGYGNEENEDDVEEEDEDDEEEDDDDDILKQSGYGSMKKPLHLSTPKTAATVKLVSALRGSREKEGIPAKNLSVTWSPEVYDPNPSAETFVRIKKPRLKTDSKRIQEFKKNGKPIGKDKGKASKGGRRGAGNSKDDKKSKYGNNSRRSYHPFDNDD